MIAIKYHFDFKLEFFQKYRDDPGNFDLDKVMIAIIYNKDFDKRINEANFIAKIKLKNLEKNIVLVLMFVVLNFTEIHQESCLIGLIIKNRLELLN